MMTHKHRPGTYRQFKKFIVDVVKGKRQVNPREPKIWIETSPSRCRPKSAPRSQPRRDSRGAWRVCHG